MSATKIKPPTVKVDMLELHDIATEVGALADYLEKVLGMDAEGPFSRRVDAIQARLLELYDYPGSALDDHARDRNMSELYDDQLTRAYAWLAEDLQGVAS